MKSIGSKKASKGVHDGLSSDSGKLGSSLGGKGGGIKSMTSVNTDAVRSGVAKNQMPPSGRSA